MKLDKIQFKVILIIFFILLVIWGVYEGQKHQKLLKDDISNNVYFTVARIKHLHKGRYSYVYFYEGIKYSGSFSGYDGDIQIVDKYFKVELSKKNPENSNLLINEEITDSAKIANSGFRKKTLNEILDSK